MTCEFALFVKCSDVYTKLSVGIVVKELYDCAGSIGSYRRACEVVCVDIADSGCRYATGLEVFKELFNYNINGIL